MKIEDIYDLNVGEVLENVDLSCYTTYKLKGRAKVLVSPKDVDSLKKLLNYIKSNGLKYKVLGNGSNLIFTNDFYALLYKTNVQSNSTNICYDYCYDDLHVYKWKN